MTLARTTIPRARNSKSRFAQAPKVSSAYPRRAAPRRRIPLDLDNLVSTVCAELQAAPQGTLVVVLGDGTVRVDDPEQPLPGWQRKERQAVLFIRKLALPPEWEVRERIEQGLRKLRVAR